MSRFLDHTWILLTVGLATYSQLIMKWKMSAIGPLPTSLGEKFLTLFHAALTPWVLSALFATFLSGVCWMITLTKFDLSYAFPFTAFNFIVMYLAGVMIFGEQGSWGKVAGTVVIMVGVTLVVMSKGERT